MVELGLCRNDIRTSSIEDSLRKSSQYKKIASTGEVELEDDFSHFYWSGGTVAEPHLYVNTRFGLEASRCW